MGESSREGRLATQMEGRLTSSHPYGIGVAVSHHLTLMRWLTSNFNSSTYPSNERKKRENTLYHKKKIKIKIEVWKKNKICKRYYYVIVRENVCMWYENIVVKWDYTLNTPMLRKENKELNNPVLSRVLLLTLWS